MSAEEEKAAKIAVLANYAEVKQHLDLLREQSLDFSKNFVAFGKGLHPDQIWNIDLASYAVMLNNETYEKLVRLRDEISEVGQEVSRLRDQAIEFGFGSILK